MSWQTVPLKRVASIRVSNVDKKAVDGEPAVRLCNYTDVYYRDTILPDQKFMAATATHDQVSAFRLHAGDVLITKDSETADDIGVPAYVAEGAPDLVCGYHLAMIRPIIGVIYGRYLHWALSSAPVREQISSVATGITRFGLRTDGIGLVELPLPMLDQQRNIAKFLDAETARLDGLIATKRKLIQRLLDRRAATTAMAVSGELTSAAIRVDANVPWMHSHPAKWRVAKLTLVATLGSGHTPSRDHPEWWEDCSIPWITTGEVAQIRDDRTEYLSETRESISEVGMANSSATLRPAGTVVLSRTASAGFSAIMRRDMATSQDFVTWTCGPLLEPRFLLLCLRAMRPDLLNRLAQGSTHKTIYMPDIESIRIPLPPVAEQRLIVEESWRHLRRIDHAVDRINNQLRLLVERRQALITAAVTGELEIPGTAA
jgi:type I restriction enzyme, S subunit